MDSLLRKRGTPNIILLVIDAGRADRFSTYGHYRPTTPNIGKIAEKGLIFERAYTVDSATPLSHFALMSGQQDWNGRAWLKKANWLSRLRFLGRRVLRRMGLTDYVGGYEHSRHSLLEILREAGYFSIGLSANQLVSPKTMQAYEGFDAFPEDDLFKGLESDPEVAKRLKKYGIIDTKANRQAVYLTADRVIEKAQKHIQEQNPDFEKPFFLFMNLMDCHDPYLVHADYKEGFGFKPNSSFNGDLRNRDGLVRASEDNAKVKRPWTQTTDLDAATIDLLRWNYDRCLGYVDQQIGRLISWLDIHEQLDDTVFFILADHGEQLGENGFFTHSQAPSEFQMRIPLIVSGADYLLAPGRIEEMVSIVDIRASIVDLIGADDPFTQRSGESLFSEKRGSSASAVFKGRTSVPDRDTQLMGKARENVSQQELDLMEARLRDLGYLD